MHADYFIRNGSQVTISESSSEGMATLEILHSVFRSAQGQFPEGYASERVMLFCSLDQLDALCAAIQTFQQERANLHSPDPQAEEEVYNVAYDAARAQDENSAEPHNESERHTMADLLATAAVNARREEQRKARATVTATFGK